MINLNVILIVFMIAVGTVPAVMLSFEVFHHAFADSIITVQIKDSISISEAMN